MSPALQMPCSISRALQFGREQLKDISPSYDLDAHLLLSHALGLSKLQLITESKTELSDKQIEIFKELLSRRIKSEPVAYIIGKKEFWGMDFEVSRDVLVPRPDTELLVDMALTCAAEFPDPILVCDLGCGSGCIAIALAFELKRRNRNFFMLACDYSMQALRLAKRNANLNKLDGQISFIRSNWSSGFSSDFDLIVSNPPYLMQDDPDLDRDLSYEPKSALFSGIDGLDDYKQIFEQLPSLLSKQGVFLGEIGYGQAHLIEKLAKEKLPNPKIDFHYDLHRTQRVVEIRLNQG